MIDPEKMGHKELVDELRLARASVLLLTEEIEAKDEQIKSLLGFQSSAHKKKVKAKHDRDDVINQKVVLELENKKLKEENAELKKKLEESIARISF